MTEPIHAWTDSRFWDKVDRSGGSDACWPWIAGHNPRGAGVFYATLTPNKHMVIATRYLWEALYGPIPEDYHVCHRCDYPACVNPSHLFLGTRSDNMRDMMAKGRGRQGRKFGEPHVKLTPDKMARVRELVAAGMPIRAVAREYGVWASSIRLALRRTA